MARIDTQAKEEEDTAPTDGKLLAVTFARLVISALPSVLQCFSLRQLPCPFLLLSAYYRL